VGRSSSARSRSGEPSSLVPVRRLAPLDGAARFAYSSPRVESSREEIAVTKSGTRRGPVLSGGHPHTASTSANRCAFFRCRFARCRAARVSRNVTASQA
jgi:hypothetical protein